jgi:hypothetical protein
VSLLSFSGVCEDSRAAGCVRTILHQNQNARNADQKPERCGFHVWVEVFFSFFFLVALVWSTSRFATCFCSSNNADE